MIIIFYSLFHLHLPEEYNIANYLINYLKEIVLIQIPSDINRRNKNNHFGINRSLGSVAKYTQKCTVIMRRSNHLHDTKWTVEKSYFQACKKATVHLCQLEKPIAITIKTEPSRCFYRARYFSQSRKVDCACDSSRIFALKSPLAARDNPRTGRERHCAFIAHFIIFPPRSFAQLYY